MSESQRDFGHMPVRIEFLGGGTQEKGKCSAERKGELRVCRASVLVY